MCLIEQPKHGKVIETNHDEEASIRSAMKDDPEKKGRTLGTAKSLRARLDVGIEAQELALALNTLNSVVWMVLTFAGGNELQYRATFHLLARPSPRYRGLLLRIHRN